MLRQGSVRLCGEPGAFYAVTPGDLTRLCWWGRVAGQSRRSMPTGPGVELSQGYGPQTQGTNQWQLWWTTELSI